MSLLQRAAAQQRGPNVSRETPIWRIDLARIRANPYQTRLSVDPDHILDLARSIWSLREDLPLTRGLQQPPTARIVRQDPDSGKHYLLPRDAYRAPDLLPELLAEPGTVVELFFGHSRWLAIQLLAHGPSDALFPQWIGVEQSLPGPSDIYQRMPLLLAYAGEEAMWEHAEAENRARKNITAIEEAISLQRAIETFCWTQTEAARRAGMSRSAAANKLRLLKLPERVRDAILAGAISEMHGRELLRLADHEEQLLSIFGRIADEEMTTRELAAAVGEEVERIEARAEKQRQLAIAREVEPDLELIDTDEFLINCSRFRDGGYWADAELIERGECGPDVCECFAMRWYDRPQDDQACVDAATPNVAYCCTNDECCREKVRLLREERLEQKDPETFARMQDQQQEAAQRKAKIGEIQARAERLVANFLAQCDLAELWTSVTFWHRFADAGIAGVLLQEKIAVANDIEAVQRAMIYCYLMGNTYWDSELQRILPDIGRIRLGIHYLGGEPTEESQ